MTKDPSGAHTGVGPQYSTRFYVYIHIYIHIYKQIFIWRKTRSRRGVTFLIKIRSPAKPRDRRLYSGYEGTGKEK